MATKLQIVFAALVALLCAALMLYVWWRSRHAPPSDKIPLVDPDDQRRKVVELRLEWSGKLFDLGVVLLGVIWGLILTKENADVKLTWWPHIVLFVSANFALLLSLFFHWKYKRLVGAVMWDLAPAQPDIFSEYIDYPFRAQWLAFMLSLIAGILTIVSIKLLGRPNGT